MCHHAVIFLKRLIKKVMLTLDMWRHQSATYPSFLLAEPMGFWPFYFLARIEFTLLAGEVIRKHSRICSLEYTHGQISTRALSPLISFIASHVTADDLGRQCSLRGSHDVTARCLHIRNSLSINPFWWFHSIYIYLFSESYQPIYIRLTVKIKTMEPTFRRRSLTMIIIVTWVAIGNRALG